MPAWGDPAGSTGVPARTASCRPPAAWASALAAGRPGSRPTTTVRVQAGPASPSRDRPLHREVREERPMAPRRCSRSSAAPVGADHQRGQAVHPTDLFRIASISKPITVVTVLQLVERKKLAIDARVWDVLELPPPSDARWKRLIILHLLQHTGGWDRDKSFDPMFRSVQIARALNVSPPAEPHTHHPLHVAAAARVRSRQSPRLLELRLLPAWGGSSNTSRASRTKRMSSGKS